MDHAPDARFEPRSYIARRDSDHVEYGTVVSTLGDLVSVDLPDELAPMVTQFLEAADEP
ncbi:MAG: hypothetical protein HYR85_19125 [Planctomycetes bacterium]|nr:hypothetical protein [Planctomycetota bacterium]MBI3845438.1 hypothetical protein [Planctomycetota bacterium]